MLTDRQAMEFLAAEVDEPEESRSSYWEEERKTYSVNADGRVGGRTVMGLNAGRAGVLKAAAHWVLQTPFRLMGLRYPDHARLQRLGRQVSARQGRPYWLDAIRQVLSLSLIARHAPPGDNDGLTVVIGDGFGIMTSLVLLAWANRRAVVVNLTKSLLLDLVNIRKAVPGIGIAVVRDRNEFDAALVDGNIRVIAVRADDAALLADAPIDLAITIASMQEMTLPVIRRYFDILRSSTAEQITFYCCNRIQKNHYDGRGPKFHDYPWLAADGILVDGVCPWSQWYYNHVPPFWHYRRGRHRIVWHRLAVMKRELAGD